MTFSGVAVTYTPAANWNGTDAFTYVLRDGQGLPSAPATVTVTVVPVNDLPLAVADSAVTTSGVSVVVAVLQNDSDADGTPLAVSAVGTPLHGSAV